MTTPTTPSITDLHEVMGYTNDPAEFGYECNDTAPELGEVCLTQSRGRWYRGIVTKVGPTRATVTYITPGGVASSMKIHQAILELDVDNLDPVAIGLNERNWDYYQREIDPVTRQHRHDDEKIAWMTAIVKEGRQNFARRKAEEARQRDVERQAEAKRIGPLGYVNVTNKSNRFDAIARKTTWRRTYDDAIEAGLNPTAAAEHTERTLLMVDHIEDGSKS